MGAHQSRTGTHLAEPARERIAEAAIRLFSKKGYDATSVREIVAAAGVTKPVLYYYFQNKEQLFHSIIRDATDEFTATLATACSAACTSFAEQLRGIASVYLDAARGYPDAVRFIHTIAFSGLYDYVLDFAAYWEGNTQLLFDVFARAQAIGWLRRDLLPRTAAFHFLSLVMGAMRAIVYFPHLAASEPIESSLVPFFLHALDGLPPTCPEPSPTAKLAPAPHLPPS